MFRTKVIVFVQFVSSAFVQWSDSATALVTNLSAVFENSTDGVPSVMHSSPIQIGSLPRPASKAALNGLPLEILLSTSSPYDLNVLSWLSGP